jgi:hypothetical protein
MLAGAAGLALAAAAAADDPQPQGAGSGPAVPADPGEGWLSYGEMRAYMQQLGVPMPPAPIPQAEPASGASEPAPAALSAPAAPNQAELARVLAVLSEMTPEQQMACFAFSQWRSGGLLPPPPAYGGPPPLMMPGYPPGPMSVPGPGLRP